MFSSHSHHRRAAFTLIELLVVIAIIAILASMIFPAFSRAREMARRTSCASNMKQLGLAFTQYFQDYDERYPKAGNYQNWAPGNGHWVAGNQTTTEDQTLAYFTSTNSYNATGVAANVEAGAIYPYVKNTQVYVCPSNRNADKSKLSYSMNCTLSGQAEFSVQNSTEVILLVDEAYPSDGYFWAPKPTETGANTSSDQLTQVHNGGGNLLFADGHVKFYPFARYPIGDSSDPSTGASSIANKARTQGAPRFYDSASTSSCTFN